MIQTNPGSGATLNRGDTVTVQVSLGKEPIKIPAGIVGMSVSNATKALEALGLSVGGVQGNPSQKVTGANPGIGEEVKPGSSVTLITK